MAKLVFGMNVSLDGYVDHDRFAPEPALFRYFIEQTRNTSGSIYGRGLYELMRYWDGDEWAQDGLEQGDLRAFAEAWRAMPKWVASRSLKQVGPNATLIGDDVAAAVRKLKADVDGEIEVGGPKLAASLVRLGLIDEYHLFLHPVVLGQGAPFFAGVQPKLRLVGSERIGEGTVKLTYAPA
ncbi:MAG TPA: dihydrofolate reductase family protein [Vitreimonas sp.]|uniref:dihydrofolate reductase family protein n=1 Tax=Vitreimonas sp. TaxID=3069702 RepID=UPI002D6DBA90|nr:dihydrofolate reductase family protein [Vitreimonas sp.]HYD87612.1 dihydrofolate reductase family protein [Vitreimonas sp.]